MGMLFRLVFWLPLLCSIAPVGFAWFALTDEPWVIPNRRLTVQDVARAKAVLKANDPRGFPAGTRKTIEVTEADINLAANYLVQRLPGSGIRVVVMQGLMQVSATFKIPKLPMRSYANLRFSLPASDGMPQIRDLEIGQVKVPDGVANWLLRQALAQSMLDGEYRLAENVVQEVDLRPGLAFVTYVWHPQLIEEARRKLLAVGDREAIRAYYRKVVELSNQGLNHGSLVDLLQPLFRFAEQRSMERDPVEENRALILVLGTWSSGRGMGTLLGDDANGVARPRVFALELQGRHDFPQHFLVSAALVAGGDPNLANAVGLFKELEDSDGGSGFSFTDLVADRSGTRFGELAVASPSSARHAQERLARGVTETDIMPKARDLPEFLSAAEFQRRYGGIDDPRYRKIKYEIERRVAAAPFYRDR